MLIQKSAFILTLATATLALAAGDLGTFEGSTDVGNPAFGLRFFTREWQDKDAGLLFQADFPIRLVDELQKRGSTGRLPVLQASKDGLGILP